MMNTDEFTRGYVKVILAQFSPDARKKAAEFARKYVTARRPKPSNTTHATTGAPQ